MPAFVVHGSPPCLGRDKRATDVLGCFARRTQLQPRQQEFPRLQRCRLELRSVAAPVQETSTSGIEHGLVEPEPQRSTSAADFSWEKNWYPVAIVRDLDVSRPNAVQLLGKKLVLWRDKQGDWRCFEDACPHRLAPLSEGRIEKDDGSLLCSYHGWRFNGQGQCTAIPQAATPEAQATAAASPRACVATHPTQVRPDGLLWVWAESGPHAFIESALTPPVTAPETETEDALWVTTWFMRDLPYSIDILAENVLDPSHVPFSHHGVIGNRYKPVIYKMDHLSEVDPKAGFAVYNQRLGTNTPASASQKAGSGGNTAEKLKQEPSSPPGSAPPKNLMLWQPPALARYKFGGPTQTQMVTYNVPTAPGRSRIFFSLIMAKDKAPKMLQRIVPLIPRWLRFMGHFEQHAVLDGDNVFLHRQDLELRRRGEDWRKNYYLPTSMDAAVTGVRRWFARVPEVPWACDPTLPAGLSRRLLLDRFETHTKHCPICMRFGEGLGSEGMKQNSPQAPLNLLSLALRFFSGMQIAVAALAAGLLLRAAAAAGAGVGHLQMGIVVPTGLALACCMAVLYLNKLLAKFIFVDYVHADHN